MSETWRRKTYYKPRVLISTEHVLTPTFDDTLVCLTGAELEMLRNLTQYLHRRSTFVSEYQDTGYLAPTNAEWDTLQGIVAELEDKLMGCPEITALLEDILTAVQCVCTNSGDAGADLGTVAPVVQVLLDDGMLIEDDPYADDTEASARRCAVAQLTVWQSWEWLTEIIQPLQENTMDAMVPIALGVLAVIAGATPLAIPAGALIAMLSLLIDVAVDGSLADVANALMAHREELTCAVYQGLAYDYRMAETRAAEVIDDMSELSPLDKVCFKAMYSPWAMAIASKAYTAGTDWAVANVAAGACDDCEWVYEMVHEWPPCPGDWTGGFPCWTGRWPGINMNEDGYSPTFTLPSIATNVDFEMEVDWMSKFNSGWTVGWARLEWQDAALDWHSLGGPTCTTDAIAGSVMTTYNLETGSYGITRNMFRLHIYGMNGQTDTNPWPFMPMKLRIKIWPEP